MMKLHDEIRRIVQGMRPRLTGISTYIFNNPELGDCEYKSAEYLTGLLKDAGFTVECPYVGLKTAFRAELCTGDGPTIAFLAEYDALPGYGSEKTPGHACGHNWIAANTVGAGLVLAEVKDKFKGKIVVFGTPAEETAGRKVDMVNAGAFNDVDAAFQFHLEEDTHIGARALAMDALEVIFTGKAAHASAYPETGINALDAIHLTYAGINCLRQQLPDDVRIHGIITHGGDAANTIPDLAKAFFYVRAAKKSVFFETFEKVKNCARGAAMMTGADLQISCPENQFDDLVLNPVLLDITAKHMEASGLHLVDKLESPGSTDVGNVSYSCPTMYANVGVGKGRGIAVHEEAFLELADSKEAHDRLLEAIECFVCITIELCQNPEAVKQAREAYNKQIS